MKASVIIPIYNQESYLRECLESVADQDSDDYEVILINDGSTDGSEAICQEYTVKYSNFRYIYQKNAGLGGARNTGLAHAHGEYIFFLDSDDAIQVNSLRKLLIFAGENNADMVYFDELVCEENLAVRSVARTYQEMDTRILKWKALELSMNPSHVWARLYRRSLFEEIEFAGIWYEDIDIFPRLVAKAEKIFYYKVPIYYYRQHERGITYQKTDERNLDVITAWHNAYVKADYTKNEKNAIERAIKKSVHTFIFFRPKYASAYAEFYNQLFADKMSMVSGENSVVDIDIRCIPLWQQADFYGQGNILDILIGLGDLYNYGGILRFCENGKIDFQEKCIQKEWVIFSSDENIVLNEIGAQKGSHVIHEIIRDCSEWNLISLKNQIKEFKIAEIVIEKAILNGIQIKGRS